eukprot:CAMPEP_0180041976 /NCGR_PEP_ID=MMETSP0984-20121128/34467_1 /TAXON_ID=483367 /ORGANISM="non described non described, Strain CCMP 2436" /LENGTH=134 /DNA_ID=CAMNT_0021969693 /DNA_START=417 /DNA_END=817 /DNA_ORIENTATION=+
MPLLQKGGQIRMGRRTRGDRRRGLLALAPSSAWNSDSANPGSCDENPGSCDETTKSCSKRECQLGVNFPYAACAVRIWARLETCAGSERYAISTSGPGASSRVALRLGSNAAGRSLFAACASCKSGGGCCGCWP